MDIRALNIQLKDIFVRLRKSAFVKNVLLVMSGTATAQVIGFTLTPIISRLFSPSDFGVLGSFSSVATIIAAGVTLQYTQAVMIPKENTDAINLFVGSCVCTLFVAFLCMVFFAIFSTILTELMTKNVPWTLPLLVVATIIAGLNESFQAWNVRVKAFKHTSASQVIRSLSSSGTQIGFGYLRAGAAGLIVSSIIADVFATLSLTQVVLRDLRALHPHVHWKRIRQLAKEYRDFPLYSASQNVVNALSSGLPVLFLTHYFGIFSAGAYAFCMRVLAAPMSLLLNALRQVLFQKACETNQEGGNLLSLYTKVTFVLFSVALFPSLILFIWAPQLFTWIFGAQWYVAGEFAQCLIIWMLVYFCNLPAVLFARIIRIQREVFVYDMFLLVGRIGVLVLGGVYFTVLQCLILFSIFGAVMNLFLILFVGYRIIKIECYTLRNILRNTSLI